MEKRDKDQVNYSAAERSDTSCSECIHYLGGKCELVRGSISPSYWCVLFEELRAA